MVTNERIGRLHLLGTLPNGLLRARCACGYPSVIIAEEDWGAVLGCPVCHAAEAKRRDEEEERQRQQAQAEARAAKREAWQRDLYLAPHVSELKPSQLRLFRALAQIPSFDVEEVANMLRCPTENAWEAILALLRENLLIEHRGVTGEVRPYSTDEPYEMRALSHSKYSVRGVALKQLREMESAPSVPAPAASLAAAPVPPPAHRAPNLTVGQVEDFISERCILADEAAESDIVLRSRYFSWCLDQGWQAVSNAEFSEALAGFAARKGKRLGLRLKTAGEVATAASA